MEREKTAPTFGFISGCSSTLALFPYLIFLLSIFSKGLDPRQPKYLIALVIGIIIAKLSGEWLFWNKFFVVRMDSNKSSRNWRASVNRSLFSCPLVIIALFSISIDACVDVLLVFRALKTAISPIWVLLIFTGCQAVMAPIHGVISDYFWRKKSLWFSLVITIIVTIASLEVYRGISAETSSFSFINLFKLYYLPNSMQMMILLCIKGLFTGTAVIGRTLVSESIQLKTTEGSHTYG